MSSPGPSPTDEPLVYRPLSGLAIAGLSVASLYAIIILYAGLRSLRQGEPLLMEGYWLLLPLSAAILSYLGQVQIRNSDGTRAGAKLARWGLGISVCFGLGYFTYSLGTYFAIRHQANRVVMETGDDSGFFPLLQRSAANPKDLNAAFLLTIAPGGRGRTRPENDADMRDAFDRPDPDGNPGALSRFREGPLAHLFQSGSDKDTKIEPLGVMNWQYGKEGFTVRRLYRVSTEDTVADVLITTKSSEGREGENRKWHIALSESDVKNKKPTDAGKVLERLRVQAVEHIKEWQAKMNDGTPWTGFAAADGTSWENLAPAHTQRTMLQDRLKEVFTGTGPNRVFLRPNLEKSTWQRDNGKLKIVVPISLSLIDPMTNRTFNLVGTIDVATKENVGAIEPGLNPQWEITRITFHHIQGKGPKGPVPVDAPS